RVALVETGFAEGFGKPALVRAERERLAFYARSLRALVEGQGGLTADAQGVFRLGPRRLELSAELPFLAETAFARVAERARRTFGRILESAPPRRFVALCPGAHGEPPGLTIVTVEIADEGATGARIHVVEEGFRTG